MSFGSFLKRAFTPPKEKKNIVRAAAAPFTAGLSLVAPKRLADFESKAIRYTGVSAQVVAFPVLPARTQAKIFGLNSKESKYGELGQKVYRGIYAAAAAIGGGELALGPSAATGAAAKGTIDPLALAFEGTPGAAAGGAAPANFVELTPAAATVQAPANWVLATPAASSAQAAKAVASTTSGAAQGSSFLGRIAAKGKDVVEAALFVGGARLLNKPEDGGARVGPDSAPQPGGAGSSINPSLTNESSAPAGDGGGSSQMTMVIAVLAALAIGIGWVFLRRKR